MSREIVEIIRNAVAKEATLPNRPLETSLTIAEFAAPEIERLLAEAREKVREMCYKAICPHCAKGNKPLGAGMVWLHFLEKREGNTTESWSEDCKANPIRQLDLTKDLAASSREEKG